MTLLNRQAPAASLATPPATPQRYEPGNHQRQPDHLPPAPAVEDQGLTGVERFLLAVGIHLACALIAIVDRPARSRRRYGTSVPAMTE